MCVIQFNEIFFTSEPDALFKKKEKKVDYGSNYKW